MKKSASRKEFKIFKDKYLSGDELSTELQTIFRISVNSGTFLPPSNPGSPSK